MKHMKYINRIVSFLTIICCLAGSALAVRTVKAEDAVPRAAFKNEPIEAPDLYITKALENADSYNGDISDLSFTFTLRLNGEIADKQEYTIINADGMEIKEDGRVRVFKTESGKFELSPGQTAWFRNLTVGTRYEVTEDEMPSSFQQVEPEGNAAVTGFITAKGEEERFVNRYIPTVPGNTTTLKVSKTISFPKGYAVPETPDFHFVLTLDGEPYGLETYTITDDRTGKFAGTGTTDADGSFTLKGGYTASFAKVKAGVDYKLEEVDIPEGWRATGSTVLEDVTKAPETPLTMNNAAASFAVSKQMKDDSSKPDVDFRFLLTREDHSVWAGAEYYLYSMSDKELIEEDSSEEQLSEEQTKFENPTHTKEDGTFTLKPDQVAVFVGIDPGTVYSVSEIGNPDYIQTLPTSTEGYKDYEVTDNVIVLPFENQAVDNRGTLTVTKKVENVKGDAPETSEDFTFKLIKIETDMNNPDKEIEVEVEKAGYSISVGGSEKKLSTDEHGKFTIKANETARFSSLQFKRYKVEEIDPPEGYTISGDTSVQIGELTRDNSVAFTFTNEYRADKLDLKLVKQNKSGDNLSEICFKLWKAKDDTAENAEWETIKKTEIGTYTTDQNGKLIIPGLESGIYYLQETETTEGYMLWENPLRIVISGSRDRSQVTVEAEGISVSNDNPSSERNSFDIPRNKVVKKLSLTPHDDSYDEAELTVINEMLYELPHSGGIGIYPCIMLGLVLMLAACVLYFKRYRSERI